MPKLLTLTIYLSVSLIIASTHPTCNQRILLDKPRSIISDGVVIKEVMSGQNQSIPLFDSNKVLIFTISHESNDEITLNLDEEYLITGIGIRQRFDGEEFENICPSSLFYDAFASYKINYTNSISKEAHPLEYPIGTNLGILNPSTLLPYQKIDKNDINKKRFKVVLKPTKMTSITIRKETYDVDSSIFNTGEFCLQFELYGCKGNLVEEENEHETLEYEMTQPNPSPIGDSSQFSDSEYTGLCSENSCTGGIGKLVDKITGVVSNPDLFVMWHLNGTGYNRNIRVGNKTISIMTILMIFDDVYFFKGVKLQGATKIGNFEFKPPIFMAVNGILFDTSTIFGGGGFYFIKLYPWITANSLQLDLYIEVNEEAPWIALSEISTTLLVEGPEEHATEVEENSFKQSLIGVSTIASLLFIVLIISLVSNAIQYIRFHKLMGDHEEEKNNVPLRQTSEINHYLKSGQFDFIPSSTYESIAEDQLRGSTVYSEPEEPVFTAVPTTVSSLPSTFSVIEMPPNPIYVSTLPKAIPEEVPGYSHLEFANATQTKADENKEINSTRTLPQMSEGYYSKEFSAKERRTSYVDQHLLSDLK